MTKAADKIIVALDLPTTKAALHLMAQVREQISTFKVGLQLYTAAGPELLREIVATGAKFFLDLKLHDIPNTIAHAVESATELGADMLTLHLSGGQAMIRAAVQVRGKNLSLLGVGVLTSATQETLHEIGIAEDIENHVLRLARLGVTAGIDGLVASPHEVKRLRSEFGTQIRIVTPGIRPSWAEPGDQKRFTTPKEALRNGADYLVIGRPITAHSNPCEAVQRILEEISA
jgi:orotidine-5'-phosphate decarboxylase